MENPFLPYNCASGLPAAHMRMYPKVSGLSW